MSFITMQFKALSIMRGVTIRLFLPTDAMAGTVTEPPYKTMYFLPGYSADATEILNYLSIRSHCELKGIAVVLVDGCNSFYIDRPEANQNFSSFVKEVVEVTRKTFPLSDKREDTFIAGISMGGYGCLYNGLRYSDIFSKICALSPSADGYDLMVNHSDTGFGERHFNATFISKEVYDSCGWNLENYYAQADPDTVPEVFMVCGKQDVLVVDGVRRLEKVMREHQLPVTYKEYDGNHELAFWEDHLDEVFSFCAGIEPGTRDRLVLGEFG